jgi:hypothetical protein
MPEIFPKDPDAVKDYKFDFAASTNGSGSTDWLDTTNSETISSHTIDADTGITVDSSSATDSDTSITVWLSGGTDGTVYEVRCEIVTSASRTEEVSVLVRVREPPTAYLTLIELKAYLGVIENDDDTLLLDAIDDAVSYIENETHRDFAASTDTKYFERDAIDPRNSRLLHLDEPKSRALTMT